MPPKKQRSQSKTVTRYEHAVDEPRTPETGHTSLLPSDDQVLEVDLGQRWAGSLLVTRIADDRNVVVDMDPYVDPALLWSGKSGQLEKPGESIAAETQPTLLWSGKTSRRDVPVLPLQRTEIVASSRIGQITERARARAVHSQPSQVSLFEAEERDLRERERESRLEFYTHGEAWKNKLICGDSLEVMASLIHYERLAGQVQMIYVDPPYGIGYNANFQQRVDKTSNEKSDQADEVLTVKAFRDTWSLGVHSYLSELSVRLYLARELLARRGSIFVQIGEDNLHRVRALLDEVFGAENFVRQIAFRTKIPLRNKLMAGVCDYLLWYASDKSRMHYQKVYSKRGFGAGTQFTRVLLADGSVRQLTDEEEADTELLPTGARIYRLIDLNSSGLTPSCVFPVEFEGRTFHPRSGHSWKTNSEGMERLIQQERLEAPGDSLQYRFFFDDFPFIEITNMWTDTQGASGKRYVVQTSDKVVERCLHMTTVPGDLVLDITCGSGVTPMCAERWGRRWIGVDVSRVSIAVTRQALLSTVFPAFVLNGDRVSDGFRLEDFTKTTLGSLSNDREAGDLRIVDQPIQDSTKARVCGPFEMLSVGRYSPEEWRGSLLSPDDPLKLANYIEVVARLYRSGSALLEGSGGVHATYESEIERVAISVGPLTGRVLARQIDEAARHAAELGFSAVHVLGWAFEVNVGELRDRLSAELGVSIELVMIRPDALAEGLKVGSGEMLFSPLSLPEIAIRNVDDDRVSVELLGVTVFDRKQRKARWIHASSNYITAWYLDHDYDGDCFVASEFFFDFAKHPNLRPIAGTEVSKDEFDLSFVSAPFRPGDNRRVAVKVVDIYGYESTVVKEVPA